MNVINNEPSARRECLADNLCKRFEQDYSPYGLSNQTLECAEIQASFLQAFRILRSRYHCKAIRDEESDSSQEASLAVVADQILLLITVIFIVASVVVHLLSRASTIRSMLV